MNVFDKGFITILCCSAGLILIALPLAMRKVPRNAVYGFRTRTTMSDDEIWFEANAHFGRGLIVSSLVGTGAAAALYFLEPFPPGVFLPVSLLFLVVPSLVAALATARFIRSLNPGG